MVFRRPNRWPAPPRLRSWEYPLLGVVVACGISLRACGMADVPLWVDEAETSLNALTILEHGVPRGDYLGIPVFENTFTQPWPEHPEYEFRDTSYSSRGWAIYHGWLPLYALAASFALNGVAPDDVPSRTPRHSDAGMRHRTRAARLAPIGFAVVFLIAIFFTGRQLYGTDCGWAALAAAAVSTSAIAFARQARYYSSTLALTAVCCLFMCRVVRAGRWRDFAGGGAALVLLFHVNLLSFLLVCAVALVVAPFTLNHVRIGAKIATLVAIVLSGTVPWVYFSGFLDAAGAHPPARTLLTAAGALRYPLERWPYVLVSAATLVWLIVGPHLRGRVPERFIVPFDVYRRPFFLLAAWATIAWIAFVGLVPAASFFASRLTLVVLVPSLLFGAMLFAAAGRVISPRFSSVIAALAFVAALAGTGRAMLRPPQQTDATPPLFRVIDALRHIAVAPDAKLYATGGDNLILRFYTGMPFQNIMPVRKSFLDTYPGEVLILESPAFAAVTPDEVRGLLGGRAGGEAEAVRLAREGADTLLREELARRSIRVPPPDDAASAAAQRIAAFQRIKTAREVAAAIAETENPMFAGYDIRNYSDLWLIFFYRFVQPAARMGPALNYAARIRDASADVLPGGWVLLRSPARGDGNPGGAASGSTR